MKYDSERPVRTWHGLLFSIAAASSLLTAAFGAAGQPVSWEPLEAPRAGVSVDPAASATTSMERAATRDREYFSKTGRLPAAFEAPFMPIPARAPEGLGVERKPAAPIEEEPALPLSFAPPSFVEGFLATTSGATPPDTNGAVGPNHLMVILNSGVTIQDKAGNTLSSVTLASFWGELSGLSNIFDPKVIYDPLAGRFLAVAVANRRSANSAALLAVSAASDPMGSWRQWMFDADETDEEWADFPYIGMTEDKITFTVNIFTISADNFQGSTIWVVDKSTALGGGAITTTSFFNSGNSAPAVALTYDAGETTQFMLTTFFPRFSGMGLLQLSMISGPATSPAFSLSSDFIFGHEWNSTFPDAPQEGSTITIVTNDDRTQNAVLRNGRLWATHTAALPVSDAATVTAAQWWEVDPFSSTAVQSGQVSGSSPIFSPIFQVLP